MRPSPSQHSARQPVSQPHHVNNGTQYLTVSSVEGQGRKEEKEKTGRAQATVRPRPLDSTLTVEPCEDHFCARAWAACTCFPVTKKSLKLHRRSLEMKFCFSMTHTYIQLWVCRSLPAISQPKPPVCPSPDPSNCFPMCYCCLLACLPACCC